MSWTWPRKGWTFGRHPLCRNVLGELRLVHVLVKELTILLALLGSVLSICASRGGPLLPAPHQRFSLEVRSAGTDARHRLEIQVLAFLIAVKHATTFRAGETILGAEVRPAHALALLATRSFLDFFSALSTPANRCRTVVSWTRQDMNLRHKLIMSLQLARRSLPRLKLTKGGRPRRRRAIRGR